MRKFSLIMVIVLSLIAFVGCTTQDGYLEMETKNNSETLSLNKLTESKFIDYISNCEYNFVISDITYKFNDSYDNENLEQVKFKDELSARGVNVKSVYSIYSKKYSLNAEFYTVENKEQASKLLQVINENIESLTNEKLSYTVNKLGFEAYYNTKLNDNRVIIRSDNYVITLLGDKEPVKNILSNFDICPYN